MKTTVCLALVVAALLWRGTWEPQAPPEKPASPAPAQLREAYGKLPLTFEANQGQTDPSVQFLSRGNGYGIFLTPTGAMLAVGRHEARQGAAVAMQFVGANPHAQLAGSGVQPGTVNYFIGNDCAQWRSGVATYARVSYSDLYPGVDLVYYGRQRELEYDFVVRPGGDPSAITVSFDGADSMKLDVNGDLVLQTAGGEIRHRKPLIYQDRDGARQQIAGGYRLTGAREVGFVLARYDASRPLVIDPVLDYATYLGGSGSESGYDIAVDTGGQAYVTGFTPSANFPTSPGAFDTTLGGSLDAYVTKLNAAGSAIH